mmetsp:Transcript_29458/g.66567  ORF Transcript_29458/g.66567 Transcript_29458/m.66567 type:complete len:123 (+) Transcript_29458:575-943(+)
MGVPLDDWWKEEREDVEDETWCWYHTCSTEFVERIGGRPRLSSPEHVQRFSKRYLDTMTSWLHSGATAWSEMLMVMLCESSGLTLGFLKPRHIGDPFSFEGRVTREQFAAAPVGRFYHALKW